MFFSYLFFLLAGILYVEAGNSAKFTLQIVTPDSSDFDNYNLYLNESLFSIDDVTTTITGYIHNNGSLFVEGSVVGVGRGYLTTSPQSSTWKVTSPWTISSGLLQLNNNATFYAVPDSSTGIYMLSADEESTNKGITLVNIKPTLSDGKILQKWPKSGISHGHLAAAIVVPIIVVILIVVGVVSWRKLRKQAMASNNINMKNYPTQKSEDV